MGPSIPDISTFDPTDYTFKVFTNVTFTGVVVMPLGVFIFVDNKTEI